MSIDYLVIGYICKDLLPNGYTIGGTVAYSALTARNLGQRVAVVTSAASDLDYRPRLDGVLVIVQDSAATTTFENVYNQGTRQQFLRDRADCIRAESIPPAWRQAAIVHLGPLAQEMDESLAELFPHALLAATPQGWMRQWDAAGRVRPKLWDEERLPKNVRAVIFSREDIGDDESRFEACARRFEIVILTDGRHGSTVAWQGEVRHFPAHPTVEVDPTGAGDIFASAFLVAFKETGDPWRAACYANCAGAASVARPGLEGIPTPEELAQCRTTHLCDDAFLP
ncbi:MAG: ribokinase [Anaerolineae bacterium]|nr:MAG: ribokinase [Anaerolineae bacterium]